MPAAPVDRRPGQLVAIAALSTALAVVVYLIAVRTHLGQRLDDIAFARRTVVTAVTTRRTDRLLGTISVASLIFFGTAILLVALARRRVALAVATGIAMGGAVATTEVLKLRVLTRPLFGDVSGVSDNTWPSGHVTVAMVLSLGVIMVAPSHLRRAALVVAALVATSFGTAVLASGWHRPSDAIGADLVALGWFAGVSAALRAFEDRRPSPSSGHVEPPPSRALLVLSAVVVLGLLMFVLWRSVDATGLRAVVYAAPYVLACIGIDVAGVIVVGTFYVFVRPSAQLLATPGGISNGISM